VLNETDPSLDLAVPAGKRMPSSRFNVACRHAGVVAVVLTVALYSHVAAAQALPAKPPSTWNPQERAAVKVIQDWIAAWIAHDPKRLAADMSEDCVFRGDPVEPLQHGRAQFQAFATKVMNGWTDLKIQQILPVGGVWDTSVLMRRLDTLPKKMATRSGYETVPVAAFFRVKDGKIEEWLDAPLIPVGPGAVKAGVIPPVTPP
jgi:limonene-1,2-epoxide hydrolase